MIQVGDGAPDEPVDPDEPATPSLGNPPIEIVTPDLPPARFVELEGRGALVVRDFGPRDAPTLMLLHGWTASADLNWFKTYGALGERFRVVAFDHRGHAAGIRTDGPFTLEDCADDAIDVATALGIDRFVPVGYSMGGTIAQLMWRRHTDRIRGLVLCATAPNFSVRRDERLSFLGLAGLATLARITPDQATSWLTDQFYLQRKSATWEPWAVRISSSHDWRMLLEAGKSIGSFSSLGWLAEIDVPTSVVVTMRDQVVPLRRQAQLFEHIPDAHVLRIDADHDAAVSAPEQFVPALQRAIASVIERAPRSRVSPHGPERPDVRTATENSPLTRPG